MKPLLTWRLGPPNSGENIPGGCPALGVQDATARLWYTSSQSPSPPGGRYVQALLEYGLENLDTITSRLTEGTDVEEPSS